MSLYADDVNGVFILLCYDDQIIMDPERKDRI